MFRFRLGLERRLTRSCPFGLWASDFSSSKRFAPFEGSSAGLPIQIVVVPGNSTDLPPDLYECVGFSSKRFAPFEGFPLAIVVWMVNLLILDPMYGIFVDSLSIRLRHGLRQGVWRIPKYWNTIIY